MADLNLPISNTNGDLLEIQKDASGYAKLILTPNGSPQSLTLILDKVSIQKLSRMISAAVVVIDASIS